VGNLSKNAQHMLLHTLGLTNSDEIYRNHFVAGDVHCDKPYLAELVGAGLMVERTAPAFCSADDRLFMATEEGRAAALRIKHENTPKLTRSQERYQRYLRVADCFESFRDFLKWDGGRKEVDRG